jgi:hypothetical protein
LLEIAEKQTFGDKMIIGMYAVCLSPSSVLIVHLLHSQASVCLHQV